MKLLLAAVTLVLVSFTPSFSSTISTPPSSSTSSTPSFSSTISTPSSSSTSSTPSSSSTISTPSSSSSSTPSSSSASSTPSFSSTSSTPAATKPKTVNNSRVARWLVGSASYGVLSTNDVSGYPFGNIASYADVGSEGIPFFYLSVKGDPTGSNALIDPRSSFAISEKSLGPSFCDPSNDPRQDPQSPICAKITLSGDLKLLDQNSTEAKRAEAALFAAHPRFGGFPKQNGFQIFKLEITSVFLVNGYDKAKFLPVSEYLNPNYV